MPDTDWIARLSALDVPVTEAQIAQLTEYCFLVRKWSSFTTLVSAHTGGDIKVLYVLCMSLMLFAWFALVSVFFTTPSVRQGFFRFGRWFNRVTGITFLVLAVRVAIAQQH